MQYICLRYSSADGSRVRGDIVDCRKSNAPFSGKEPQFFVCIKVPDKKPSPCTYGDKQLATAPLLPIPINRFRYNIADSLITQAESNGCVLNTDNATVLANMSDRGV